MTYWEYHEPGDHWEDVTVRKSEAGILREYYPYWAERMRRVGKADEISEAACIEDWVVVHWAQRVPE